MTDNPFHSPTTTTTITRSSLVILHILGLAFHLSPLTLDIPPLVIFHSPPFFFKVSLILRYTSSFVAFLDKDALQHFIHMLTPNPMHSTKTPPVFTPLPLSFISLHSYIFQSAAFVMMQHQSFRVIYPSRPHVVLSDPLLPSPRTRSTWMITHTTDNIWVYVLE